MKKVKVALLLVIFSIFSCPSFALANSENADLFDQEIFSLSKKKENAFDSASSTYVLTSEDMRRSGATSIASALRLVPGLQVARVDGNKWAISSRGFNRQFANKLLVMIDGRTLYTPLFSGTFWDIQDYPLEDIERIEVVRGPGGTIWGANAVNGIINIITKNSTDTQGQYASAIVGTEDRFIGEVRYGGRTEKNNHYRVYAKHVDRDSLDKTNSDGSSANANDGYINSQAGFRYDVRSIKDSTISVHGDIRRGFAKNYFDFSSLNPASYADGPSNKQSKGANLVFSWDKTFSRKSSTSLNAYFDYDKFDINVLSREAQTFDFDFQHFYDFSSENQLSWGLGYRLITDRIGSSPLVSGQLAGTEPYSYDPEKRNSNIFSAFLQEKYGLIPNTLYLTTGSKFENNDYTGFEIQPNAKLTLFPSKNQTLWASVSRAVRTPTRGEDGLTLTFNSGSTTITQKGSTSYNSEKVIAYEMGYRIKPVRTILFDTSIFYNKYSDLRTFERVSPTFSVVSNRAYGSSYGAEVSAKWQVNDDWLLEAGYDYLKMDLEVDRKSSSVAQSTYNIEGESPQNQFRLRSNYNIAKNWEFDNVVYYVDSLPNSKDTTDINGVPSYVRFDSRIGYLPFEGLELSLVGQNLTDDRHSEFNRAEFNNKVEVGRNIYFKVVWQY